MNSNAKAWVAALRSGEYEQGTRYLHADGRYCCLGVACELAVMAGVPVEVTLLTTEHGRSVAYDHEANHLPASVQKWLGLATACGEYVVDDDGITCDLTALNDGGVSFAEIADGIEDEPEGLFGDA